MKTIWLWPLWNDGFSLSVLPIIKNFEQRNFFTFEFTILQKLKNRGYRKNVESPPLLPPWVILYEQYELEFFHFYTEIRLTTKTDWGLRPSQQICIIDFTVSPCGWLYSSYSSKSVFSRANQTRLRFFGKCGDLDPLKVRIDWGRILYWSNWRGGGIRWL